MSLGEAGDRYLLKWEELRYHRTRFPNCRCDLWKGRSIYKRQDDQTPDSGRNSRNKCYLSSDVCRGVPSLIGPLDLTLCKTLLDFDSSRPSRSATIVKAEIESFITTLLSRDFKTKRIMSDGEGAISKLTSHLNSLGMEVDISGAGGHVPQIERRIRMVKERVRAHIAHKLHFTLTRVGIAMLVLFCVSRINFQFSSTRSDGASPRELFCGRRVDGNLDFRVGFGDYVQATVPNTNNTTEPRTEDCIVMLPSGNLTGSVTMMKLVNMQLVKRDQFVILPITASAIKQMNDSALKEGRTLVVRSDMTYTQENTLETNALTFVRINDTVTQDPILNINRDQIDQTYAGNVQPEVTETPTFADEIGMPEQPGPYNEGGVETPEYTPDQSDPGDTDLAAVPSPDQPGPMQPVYGHRSRMLDLFHSGVPMQHRDTVENRGDHVLNISLREAMRTDGERTAAAINLELTHRDEGNDHRVLL
jgi:hypothetical protein